jgi:hypothetical protein
MYVAVFRTGRIGRCPPPTSSGFWCDIDATHRATLFTMAPRRHFALTRRSKKKTDPTDHFRATDREVHNSHFTGLHFTESKPNALE